MMWGILLIAVLSAPPSAQQIKRLERRVDVLRTEIKELKSSVQQASQEREHLEAELRVQEDKFDRDFRRVIHPLLSWPKVSAGSTVKSWVQRSHARLLLQTTRDRTVREPLELIADRDLMLRRVAQSEDLLQQQMDALESRESLLSLQLDELKLLKSKSTPKRRRK
jgi:prefoldin subunit 5